MLSGSTRVGRSCPEATKHMVAVSRRVPIRRSATILASAQKSTRRTLTPLPSHHVQESSPMSLIAPRRFTRVLHVGDVKIGGENPIVVQSMTTADTRDAAATLRQIHELADVGCEIVR